MFFFFLILFLLNILYGQFLCNRPANGTEHLSDSACSVATDEGKFAYMGNYYFFKRLECHVKVFPFFCFLALLWSYYFLIFISVLTECCCLLVGDSFAANLVVSEGESVYDFCWYPYMSASGLLLKLIWWRVC